MCRKRREAECGVDTHSSGAVLRVCLAIRLGSVSAFAQTYGARPPPRTIPLPSGGPDLQRRILLPAATRIARCDLGEGLPLRSTPCLGSAGAVDPPVMSPGWPPTQFAKREACRMRAPSAAQIAPDRTADGGAR